MSLLSARQAVDWLNRDRTQGRRALGYRRFLRLVDQGHGPARVRFGDDGPAMYSTEALRAWEEESFRV